MNLDIESPEFEVSRANHVGPALRQARIERDTALAPRAVAVAVWEEAGRRLGTELPRVWIDVLAGRAGEIYAHNARFRRLLRRKGDAGRDWLWAFMRHWMLALVLRSRTGAMRNSNSGS
jgi:hypothetical protein